TCHLRSDLHAVLPSRVADGPKWSTRSRLDRGPTATFAGRMQRLAKIFRSFPRKRESSSIAQASGPPPSRGCAECGSSAPPQLPIHFSNSQVSIEQAPSPVFFVEAPGRPVFLIPS